MTLWDQVSDEQRDGFVAACIGALPTSGIPPHLHEGLVRYFADGILPGSFLQAVLCNDLAEAVRRADPFAFTTLGHLVTFLIDVAPPTSWGSRDVVRAWTTTPNRLEI